MGCAGSPPSCSQHALATWPSGLVFERAYVRAAGGEPWWLMGVRLPGASSCAPGNG